MKSGTRVFMGDEEVQIQWGDRRLSKTIKLSNANDTLIMQSAPGFHQFKAFTTNIPDDESLVQGDHLPEDLGDPNQSALNNSTKGKPQTLNSQGITPEIGVTPMAESTGPHLSKPLNNPKMITSQKELKIMSQKEYKIRTQVLQSMDTA
jgi:hypothetical protein